MRKVLIIAAMLALSAQVYGHERSRLFYEEKSTRQRCERLYKGERHESRTYLRQLNAHKRALRNCKAREARLREVIRTLRKRIQTLQRR